MPYEVGTDGGDARLEHFQCYQYAAFQALDLLRVHELLRRDDARAVAAVCCASSSRAWSATALRATRAPARHRA